MDVFLTLDYELFLSAKTGTVDKCLVEPMEKLLEIVNRYGVKINIFVDAAYLLRLFQLKDKNFSIKQDFDKVYTHLRSLSEMGHSIQLHFHPQWLYSNYNGHQWDMDFDHYKLSDLSLDEQKVALIAANELLRKISNNKINTYRAGGYSIENFMDMVEIFKSQGISYDTSVLRGAYLDTKNHRYDYRKIPLRTSYRFKESIKIENNCGDFVEYPISTIVLNPFKYSLLKYKLRKVPNNYKWSDGMGIDAKSSLYEKVLRIIQKFFHPCEIPATIDGVFSCQLQKIFNNVQTYGNQFVIIGHPKNFTPYSLNQFELFVESNFENLNFCLFHEYCK